MGKLLGQSLLRQLLGLYLIFVGLVIGTGLLVNFNVQQQLRADTQANDLTLAQSLAIQTDTRLREAKTALSDLAANADFKDAPDAAAAVIFRVFKSARPELDRVFFLDPSGIEQQSVPDDVRSRGSDFSKRRFFQQARLITEPVVEAGIVDLTTFNAVVTIAIGVRDQNQKLIGVLAANLRLDDLSEPLLAINTEQAGKGRNLVVSIIDDQGQLIATPERERLLQSVLKDVPAAASALSGQPTTSLANGPHNQLWLYSAVPIPSVGWAVIVRRPASEALAGVNTFTSWLTAISLLFGLGGLFFWLALLRRVITPLQSLARWNRSIRLSREPRLPQPGALAKRADEVGELARSLKRLEQDVFTRLTELHTLLETSNAVVGTLDPQAVVETIIQEVLRLVDIATAGVLVADNEGILKVLACSSHSEYYAKISGIPPDDPESLSARALREKGPVQVVAGQEKAGQGSVFPAFSYQEGFRTLLAIPLFSPRIGNGVLLVNRFEPQPFNPDELDLLLTFANYAALAWEHAVLYERSDERLQQIALENERLYRRVAKEKQTLAAIMSSMSDGLVLAGPDGVVLYTNPGVSAFTGLAKEVLESGNISAIYASLRSKTQSPEAFDAGLFKATSTLPKGLEEPRSWQIEIKQPRDRVKAVSLRLFDVQNETGELVGQGLLLRDITQQREMEDFKTTLLAAVGHELRTPLTAIKGHASTLLANDVSWTTGEQQHFLQTISLEADRVAQLVTNLLDLSRLEAGTLLLHRYPCDVDELINSVVQRLSQPDLKVTVEVPVALAPVVADRPRTEVILTNLLTNAIAYGEGEICLKVEQLGNKALIQVANNGPEIADAELEHIFERFYRARQGVVQRAGGTGLGLAICKAFVEAQGGEIWAESSQASGTVISFTLPLAA
jgi:signal transduction histidine kinase/HAMP domain-containing protein